MTSLVDIKKSINIILKTNFPGIKLYANEIVEGFVRPCMFTQMMPVSSDYDTVNFTSNKLMIVINYFSKDKTDLENIKMYDDLRKAFGMTLKVNNRYFLMQDIRTSTVDGVLQFKFDLDYFVDIEKIDDREIMQDLETEIIKE